MEESARHPRKPIAVLPPRIAQRIAAGEVVDRPASVVRELIENALDAGATSIAVELRGAGLELIMVSDDGHGIEAEELPLAVARHGTSKIQDLEDLDAIASLGFRGEALPSIAAVATLEITSATREAASAARIVVRDGEIVEQQRTARLPGTTVRVRELFAGQPVRRGFLPSARAETALCLTLLRRYALSWPHVRFSLQLEGRHAFRSAGLGEAGALSAVFGASAARLHAIGPIDAGSARVDVQIADPGLTRGDREGLIVIVNQRWVAPPRWHAALENTYRPLLPRGRHPIVVLRVTVDPGRVDVNLHPHKLDIRLVGEDDMLRQVGSAIRSGLGRTPSAAALLGHPLGQPRQRRLRLQGHMLEEQSVGYGADIPDLRRLRLVGQVMGTMLLVEDRGALYLIDQHRADERAIYERLRADTSQGAQELLQPLSLELRPDKDAALERALPELERLGFRCERFGHRAFVIRSVPLGVPESIAPAMIEALGEHDLDILDWREPLLATVACRAAVKRRHELNLDQMHVLVAKLAACEIQTLCPHGSPIIARVDETDLARHFDWR